MQLNDLEIFRQLYELHSINATARALGFAQSNITARLQSLEREFNVQLFHRSHQGITPTKAGTEFYAYATAALKATARLRAHLHPDNARPQAIISTLLFNYLTSYRHVLSLQDYQYQLLSSTAIHTLTNTRVATVITYAQFQQPDYQPGPLHYLPAMFLRAPSATPSLPLLINSDQQCPFRARSLHFAAHHPVTTQAIDSWAAIINLVRAGQGVALLPAYLTQDDTLTRIPGTPGYRVPYRTYTRQ